MKKLNLLSLLMLFVGFVSAQSVPALQYKTFTYNGPASTEPYQLIFHDDFSGNTINTEDWALPPSINDHSPELMDNPWSIFADPSAASADFRELISVRDGKLILNACRQEQWYTHYVEYPDGTREDLGYFNEDGNWEIVDASWKSSKVISNHNSAASSNSYGCFQYGKFQIRAKIAKAKNNIWNSFWFFGPAGEIDMFEIYKNEDYLRSNMHLQNLLYYCDDDLNYDEGSSYYDTWDISSGEIDPDANNCELLEDLHDSKKHDLGDLSQAYHDYTVEWTPFKVQWSVDGNIIRTVYQYYDIVHFPWPWPLGTDVLFPVTSLTPGQEYTLFEAMWFPRDQYINMIISLSGNEKPNKHYCDEMKIDEVKVWQKMQDLELVVNNGIALDCISEGQQATFEIVSDAPFGSYNWETSGNLEIISTNGNQVTVEADPYNNGYKGWVEVSIPNSKSCYDIKRRHEFWVNGKNDNSVYFNQYYESCSNTAILELAGPATELYNYTILSVSATSNHPSSTVTTSISQQIINVSLSSSELSDFIAFEVVLQNNTPGCEHTITTTLTLVMYKCNGLFTNCDNGEKISIYPSPTNGIINISYENFDAALFSDDTFLKQNLQIINAESGQVMETKLLESTIGSPMDVSHYPDGLYYIYSEVCKDQPVKTFLLAK